MRTLTARWIGLAFALAVLAGCAKPPRQAVVLRWWMAHTPPTFDPDGPPDPQRFALERLLTRSLVAEDSLGEPALDAASGVEISADGKRYMFRLRTGLRFTDGSPCQAAHFRDGLIAGLARGDHATRAWLLAAVRGVDAVRAGRPLPRIGISAPDSGTVLIELARPDSLLLRKLASPGASSAWKSRKAAAGWSQAVGLGPYRVGRAAPRELALVRSAGSGPDTVDLRFGIGAARARAALRGNEVDLVWPLPPELLDQPLPPGYETRTGAARPARRLSLVLRADVPPTTRLPARRAFVYGIAVDEMARRVGRGAREVADWLPGAGTVDLPRLDRDAVGIWLERGKLGRSFHVRLAYDADEAGAAVARSLQGDLARSGLSADLVSLRGGAFDREALSGQAHALLVEEQGLISGPVGVLAPAVMPLRGPAVGAYRTGWRTREFDPWLLARNPQGALNLPWAERRLEEETIVTPLCQLDWVWAQRPGGPAVAFHPRFGPSPAGAVSLTSLVR